MNPVPTCAQREGLSLPKGAEGETVLAKAVVPSFSIPACLLGSVVLQAPELSNTKPGRKNGVKGKITLTLAKAVRQSSLKTIAMRARDWALLHIQQKQWGFIVKEQGEGSVEGK